MTTQRYAHLADDPLRRASEAIGDSLMRALGTANERAAMPEIHEGNSQSTGPKSEPTALICGGA
jgi:hypothetical protein